LPLNLCFENLRFILLKIIIRRELYAERNRTQILVCETLCSRHPHRFGRRPGKLLLFNSFLPVLRWKCCHKYKQEAQQLLGWQNHGAKSIFLDDNVIE
jgi:hypothetical protein